MVNLITFLVIAAIVGGAGVYIYKAKKSGVKCIGCPSGKTCGKQIRYLPNQKLEGVNCQFPFPYVAQWYQYQCDFVNGLDTELWLEQPLYTDTADLSVVDPEKKKTLLEGAAALSLYGNRLQAGQSTLFFEDIRVITVLGKNKLNIYHKDALYQIKGSKRFNALKYMNIFYRSKNQKSQEVSDFLGI